MSYKIHTKVIQTDTSRWNSLVEKTMYTNDGASAIWTEVDGEQTLTMSASGSCGTLRFKDPQGHYILVLLGVHNYKQWCDIKADLKPCDTGAQIQPLYYTNGTPEWKVRWENLANHKSTSPNGVSIDVNFYKEEDKNYYATITIQN